MTGLRQIDCAQDLRDRCHTCTPTSDPVSCACSDALRTGGRHTERPRRRVASRERVGENLIDLAFFGADILWRLVLRIPPVSFLSIRGTFHVRCPISPGEKMPISPVCTNTVLIRSNRHLATRSEASLRGRSLSRCPF